MVTLVWIRHTAWFDVYLSHGGAETQRVRIQIPVDDDERSNPVFIQLRAFVTL